MKEEERKYKNTEEQLKVKLENLKQLIMILDSDMENYEKIMELCRIYGTPEKFRSAYQLIYNNGYDDPMFKDYIGRFIDIYNFYLACQGNELLDNAKYILSIEGYIEDYEKAEAIIIDYIKSEDSYKFSEFLINHGINDKIFERYTKIISTINVNLYDKFLERFEENKKLRFISNRETIKELAKEIQEQELEVLEFLRRIPFITSRTFVNKLMELSQTEAEIKSPDLKVFNYINAINSVVKFNEQLYKDKELRWVINIDDGLKNTIVSDEEMLKTIIQNILEVILKSVEMGEIAINISLPDEECIKNKNLFGENFVLFSISSSSLLLSEADLEYMFDPYKIVDTSNRKNLLRAMTLACVKNLVQALNGVVWVESKILKNTSFNVIIPLGKN